MAAARAKASPARQRSPKATPAFDQRKPAASIVLRLPVPPSSNNVWAIRKGGKGLRLSDRYARWLEEAGWRLQQQRPGRIDGGYSLTLFMPASSGMDLDNAIAGVSDILQYHGVIVNDREAETTDLRWHGAHDDVVVALRPFDGTTRHLRPIPNDVEAPV